MTRNKAELHQSENGTTGLGIVSGIILDESGTSIKGLNRTLEMFIPWDISEWRCEPATYVVKRSC